MKLTLETTFFQSIEVDDARGKNLVLDWTNGDESLVEPAFDDAERYGYQTRLYEEMD